MNRPWRVQRVKKDLKPELEGMAVDKLRYNGIRIREDKFIEISSRNAPGLKLWGPIDCLCFHFGYKWGRVF